MYGALDISTSGMVAQRTRMAVASANIANASTILDAEGNVNPFRRRLAHFAPGDPTASSPGARAFGVHVAEIEIDAGSVRWRYEPGNPYADERGYVPFPDIDVVKEQLDALEASRAYEANVVAAETGKTMMGQVLRLLA